MVDRGMKEIHIGNSGGCLVVAGSSLAWGWDFVTLPGFWVGVHTVGLNMSLSKGR